MSIVYGDIEKLTLENNYFRHVISTTEEMQLVLMCLQPGEDIGMEVHPNVTQFFRVELGEGIAKVNYNGDKRVIEIKDKSFVLVPSGSYHNIINTSDHEPLKLYTIYSPPNHPHGKIDEFKPEEDTD